MAIFSTPAYAKPFVSAPVMGDKRNPEQIC